VTWNGAGGCVNALSVQRLMLAELLEQDHANLVGQRRHAPQASWSWMKSSDQRELTLASTRIGVRVPTALRRARRLRTAKPSSR
jgi:hypothetical protein